MKDIKQELSKALCLGCYDVQNNIVIKTISWNNHAPSLVTARFHLLPFNTL